MRIGTMFLGTVDSLSGESIQTKFFVLGVPLVPLSSHYVVQERANGISGFEIPLSGKSVALGYLRTAAWLIAFLCGLFYFVDRRQSDLLPWTIGFGAFALFSTFWLGRLSKTEKLQRLILKAIVGVGAPSSLLPATVREETAGRLLKQWNTTNGTLPWDRAIETGKTDPLLFVVAEYHQRPDLAQQVFERLLANTPDPSQGPYR